MNESSWEEYVEQAADRCKNGLLRYDKEHQVAFVDQMKSCVIDDKPVPKELIEAYGSSWDLSRFLETIVNGYSIPEGLKTWNTDSPFVKSLISGKNLSEEYQCLRNAISGFINEKLNRGAEQYFDTFMSFLLVQGFSDRDIAVMVTGYTNPWFKDSGRNRASRRRNDHVSELPSYKNELTKIGEWTASKLVGKKKFLGLVSEPGLFEVLNPLLIERNSTDMNFHWFRLLYLHFPEKAKSNVLGYIKVVDHYGENVNMAICLFLLQEDPSYVQQILEKLLENAIEQRNARIVLYYALEKQFPGKYDAQVRAENERELDLFKEEVTTKGLHYEGFTAVGYVTCAFFSYLWQKDEREAAQRIEQFFIESRYLRIHHITFIHELMKEASLPILFKVFEKGSSVQLQTSQDFYERFFDLVASCDLTPYLEQLIEFMVERGNRSSRETVSTRLIPYLEKIKDQAILLLSGKTVNHRVSGSMLLAKSTDESVLAILNKALDSERNDDTRDIMLEALKDKRFAKPLSYREIADMIGLAKTRKKLSKWSEKWLQEDELPALYLENGKKLDSDATRFLFYRMKRVKGLNSDIEARQLFNHIDNDKSLPFAKALLNAFGESNSDNKIKFYLTIAAFVGNDEMTSKLNALFRKAIADKRMVMAQYMVGSLAMVGTDKALRSVETIYRKFANKRPQVSAAAKEALESAALELELSMDQLSDRIIPNFDFEGIYRTFEVEGQEYRAFISTDFKLNYLNEDNKVRKSLPPNTSKELKSEFKEIEKEIREVIKSQSGRLEKYMTESRKWRATDWREFFFENPILFVYGLKLLWGVYDEKGKLITSFYCSEDASYYDLADEEVELSDDQFVGILHPVDLSESDLQHWKDKAYEMGLTTIFPVLDRSVFLVPEEEKEAHYTKMYFKKKVPKGADHVNSFLMKRNWLKSTGDGARSEFTKHYRDGEIVAYASIDGPAAFYQGGNTPAEIFEVNFHRKTWNNKIKLQDIPAAFFSETMYDLDLLLEE